MPGSFSTGIKPDVVDFNLEKSIDIKFVSDDDVGILITNSGKIVCFIYLGEYYTFVSVLANICGFRARRRYKWGICPLPILPWIYLAYKYNDIKYEVNKNR